MTQMEASSRGLGFQFPAQAVTPAPQLWGNMYNPVQFIGRSVQLWGGGGGGCIGRGDGSGVVGAGGCGCSGGGGGGGGGGCDCHCVGRRGYGSSIDGRGGPGGEKGTVRRAPGGSSWQTEREELVLPRAAKLLRPKCFGSEYLADPLSTCPPGMRSSSPPHRVPICVDPFRWRTVRPQKDNVDELMTACGDCQRKRKEHRSTTTRQTAGPTLGTTMTKTTRLFGPPESRFKANAHNSTTYLMGLTAQPQT